VSQLVENRKVRKSLASLPEWWELIERCCLVADRNDLSSLWNQQLPGDVVQKVFCSIICASSDNTSCLSKILESISLRFHILSVGSPDFEKRAQDSTVRASLCLILDMMCGVALALGESSASRNLYSIVFKFLQSYFDCFANLFMRIYAHDIPIVSLMLRIFCAITSTEIFEISADDSYSILQWSLTMVQAYGQISQQRLSSLRTSQDKGKPESSDDEHVLDDVKILIKLLEQISSKETIDSLIPSPENNCSALASEAAIVGTSILIQYLDRKLLHYPEIICPLFDLLDDLVTTYPDKVVQKLSDASKAQIIDSLEFSLSHHDSNICKSAFHMIKALGVYCYSNLSHIDPQEPFLRVIPRLQEKIMSMILVENIADEILDALSDALLALILSSQESFSAVATHIVQIYSSNQNFVHAFTNGFKKLDPFPKVEENSTPGNRPQNLDPNGRVNRIRFRKCLREFIEECRSFIQFK
jgi:hypothetical protein